MVCTEKVGKLCGDVLPFMKMFVDAHNESSMMRGLITRAEQNDRNRMVLAIEETGMLIERSKAFLDASFYNAFNIRDGLEARGLKRKFCVLNERQTNCLKLVDGTSFSLI